MPDHPLAFFIATIIGLSERFFTFIASIESNMTELLYQLFQQHPVICTDSRSVTPGSLFFALRGDNFDGNRYALKAIEAGAICAVVDDPQYSADHKCLLVDNVLSELQQLARYHRLHLSIPFIGITGSNGKTTTKELIATVLSQRFKTCYTHGNLNNHIGVPLTLLSVTTEHEMAVVEMGANHQGEIAQLCAIAEPDYGLITNIGRAHLGGFGGFEGVVKAKTELYNHLKAFRGNAFVNTDNPLLITHAEGLNQITYGASAGATFNGRILNEGPKLAFAFTHMEQEYPVRTQLIGHYNFDNVMAAVAVGLTFGIKPENVVKAIESYTPSNHRSQWITTKTNQVVMDAYNANPSSMEAALDVFAAIATDRPRVLILGGMRELGDESDQEHHRILEKVLAMLPDRVLLVGDEFKGMHNDWFADTETLAVALEESPISNALILVKGSHGNHLETILPLL